MKQPKRPTRKDKIAAGNTKREYRPRKNAEGALQAQLVQQGLADLTARVEALEAPKTPAAKPQGRPQRVFFGKGNAAKVAALSHGVAAITQHADEEPDNGEGLYTEASLQADEEAMRDALLRDGLGK